MGKFLVIGVLVIAGIITVILLSFQENVKECGGNRRGVPEDRKYRH